MILKISNKPYIKSCASPTTLNKVINELMKKSIFNSFEQRLAVAPVIKHDSQLIVPNLLIYFNFFINT